MQASQSSSGQDVSKDVSSAVSPGLNQKHWVFGSTSAWKRAPLILSTTCLKLTQALSVRTRGHFLFCYMIMAIGVLSLYLGELQGPATLIKYSSFNQ